MITDYRLDEIQARPIYKLSGWVYKAGNTNYGVEASRDFQLAEDDFSANGNTIRVEGGGAYPIGNAVCKTCSLTLKESANYSVSDFSGACIELMIKAYNSTGSWVVTGDYYFVQTAKKTGGQIVLECADFMSKANVPYKKGGYLASTATLKNLFADVCSKCGVAVDSDNTFPNSDFTYTLHAWQNFNSYTCRQMLGFIAMIAGGNALAIAGGTGFKINTLNNAGENALYQWSRFTDEAESITVTGVEMTENTGLNWKPVVDPATYKSSTYASSYVLDLTDAENPLFKGRDQQAVDLIMTAVSGLTMRNFSGTHIGYPLAEYGDRAAITHRGGSLSTYITEYEWNISGATTFACNVNGAAANNETYSGSGGAITSEPEGSGGTAATISIGTVTTGEPGSNAQVTNSGTATAAVFDFVIPRGATGKDGKNGENGATFTPYVLSDGTLIWANDKGLANPEPVNIKGSKGDAGTFRINVTYSDGIYSTDKTFAEIKAAYDAGQQPFIVYGGDTVYTLSLCSFALPEYMFMDFERYLVGKDTLKTDKLRIYSYTTDNGSNIDHTIDEFNVPNCTTYIKVDSTDDVISTVNGETYADIQALIDSGKPVVVRFADAYDFYYFETFGFSDSSGVHIRLNFRCYAGSDLFYELVLRDDNTWVMHGTRLQTTSITDSGGYFTTDTVEGALQEIGAELAGINTLLGSGEITS